MTGNPYERDSVLAEYLLFHYGDAAMTAAHPAVAAGLFYPVRCVTDTFELARPSGRALDLGCAVGRSSFELARYFDEVIGIDYSARFIETANRLKETGRLDFQRKEEGFISTSLTAEVPPQIDRSRVRFQRGDAMNLPEGLGRFDAVLLANLVDRLSDPKRCLERMRDLVAAKGQLVITSPYTWLEEYTPRENWLCAENSSSLDGLKALLEPAFELLAVMELPFLIREHARKFQWSLAQATVWLKK